MLVFVAAQLATVGTIPAITSIAFIGLALRFSKNLQNVAEPLAGLQATLAPVDQMVEIMSAPVIEEASEEAALLEPGSAELDDVTFGYVQGTPVLNGLSFTARPGTMTAIVGPSGSGKTTVARLIARFWEVNSGQVSVGGAPINMEPTAQLMNQLSIVFQDVYLFDDTLEENILVGRPSATHDEVLWAAELSGVTEIAERLPAGWNTRVGEGGTSLSGGERQRVSIARALLKKSPIVLFDEATSALDAENEQNVVASIDELRANATFIVIAHKLTTIARADQIIVLGEDGRIAETGTHDELYTAGGAYRRYWDQREQAEGWRLSI